MQKIDECKEIRPALTRAGIATCHEKCLQTFRLVVTAQYIYHTKAIENAAATINRLRHAETTVGDYTRLHRAAHTALHDMDASHYHATVLTQMHRILRGIDDIPEMSAIVLQYSKIDGPTNATITELFADIQQHAPTQYVALAQADSDVPCATVQGIMLPTVAPRRSYPKTIASIQQPLTLSVNSATTTSAANVEKDAAMKHATAASSARSPTTSKAPLLRSLPAYSLKQL
jgi:hypothetical protein